MKKVIQEHNMSTSRLEQLLNEGYEIVAITPELHSRYQATEFYTRLHYVMVKDDEDTKQSVAD